MLWFERQVVRALMRPDLDPELADAVEYYVDVTLHSMPEHLRAGVAAESLAFGASSRVRAALGRLEVEQLAARVEGWKSSKIDVVRQYVRLLESLVLFVENELATDAA